MGQFIKGKKAVFEKYEDALFRATLCVEGEARGEELVEEVFIRCAKIPRALFEQVVAFLAWCHKMHYAEGMLYFVYRQDPFSDAPGTWEVACPLQYVTGAAVCAHPEKEAHLFADAVGDIHSHPAMSWSGHSSIDDHDERSHNHGIYMVASWKSGQTPTLKTVDLTIYGYVRGRRVVIRPEHLIDFGSGSGKEGFPMEWMAKVFHGGCKICHPEDPSKKPTERITGFGRGSSEPKPSRYFDSEDYKKEHGYPGIDWM